MIRVFLTFIIIGCFLVLSLFNHWEPSHETWGYWTFARILWETGEFIITDRSPLYVTYLLLFRWLPFPVSIITEYLISTAITVTVLLLFFSSYIGRKLATVGAILSIPVLQMTEPPVQKLALAISMGALLLRKGRPSPIRISVFYALLGVCSLLRSTYLIMLLVFLIGDGFQVIRLLRHRERPEGAGSQTSQPRLTVAWRSRRKSTSPTGLLRFTRNDGISLWPVLLVLGFYLIVVLRQSPHPWNNVYFATTRWFPHDGKTFGIIHNYNVAYALETYGTREGPDFYFTNQEVFGGARDTVGAIRANPAFVARNILQSFLRVGFLLSPMSTISSAWFSSFYSEGTAVYYVVSLIGVGMLIFSAYAASRDSHTRRYIISLLGMLCATVAFLPAPRHMLPFLPLFFFSALWFGGKFHRLLVSRIGVDRPLRRYMVISLLVVSCAAWFSNGVTLWGTLIGAILHDATTHQVALLQKRPKPGEQSLVASFLPLQTQLSQCNGVMTLEYTFLAAFTSLPVSSVYDPYDIPPFGTLGEGTYNGLTPQRIPCLAISEELRTRVGAGTNHQIRYQSYIRPYQDLLIVGNAQQSSIPSFGTVVVAP